VQRITGADSYDYIIGGMKMSPNESSTAWPLPVAEPEEVGFSSERLGRIRPAMQKYVDEQ